MELRVPTGKGVTLDVYRDIFGPDKKSKIHQTKTLVISRGSLHSDWVDLKVDRKGKVVRLSKPGDPKDLVGSPVVIGLTDLAKGGGWKVAEPKSEPEKAKK